MSGWTGLVKASPRGSIERVLRSHKIVYCFSVFDLARVNRAPRGCFIARLPIAPILLRFRKNSRPVIATGLKAREITRDDRTRNNPERRSYISCRERNHSIARKLFLVHYLASFFIEISIRICHEFELKFDPFEIIQEMKFIRDFGLPFDLNW